MIPVNLLRRRILLWLYIAIGILVALLVVYWNLLLLVTMLWYDHVVVVLRLLRRWRKWRLLVGNRRHGVWLEYLRIPGCVEFILLWYHALNVRWDVADGAQRGCRLLAECVDFINYDVRLMDLLLTEQLQWSDAGGPQLIRNDCHRNPAIRWSLIYDLG